MTESLREALGAARDPEFTMMLPEGWSRLGADEESRDRLLADVRARLLAAHRPDLWAAARSSIANAFESLRRAGGIAVMMQTSSGDGVPFVPASVTASIQTGPDGTTLDEFVSGLISRGATPLGDDKRFIRLEEREMRVEDGVRLGVTTVRYLTPVPGSRRHRALLLTAVLPHEPDTPEDDPLLVSTRFTIDAHVATLRWLPPAEGRRA
ncbi:hypothetical protein [Agromyces marinus]|uniref:Uncharacterized protein n=1 Tax=Agromyces marinus TaxID=1389020 RepID=A0ABM8H3W6_9MICO|nr:hypothetical protein [Agromyces marinus]UIP59473.1 hypothetical protein DSM26151_23800 [Agromyces marinus]BDZ55481.1 hypothetical protein GCM10025870_25540 [Agromyces marinus]